MSGHFEETAHPRGTAGKFAAKTMPEADGGTEAELGSLDTGAGLSRQARGPIEHLTLQSSDRSAREVARLMIEHGDLSPSYQRGSVWHEDQRVGLVRSWLSGVPVPAVIANDRFSGPWPKDANRLPVGGHEWSVVDGKQRIETAIAWFDGDLPVPASWFPEDHIEQTIDTDDGPYVTYTGLTPTGQRLMSNRAKLPVIEAQLATEAEEADLYLLVNGGGTPQTDADMAHAARVAGR